MIMMNGKRGSLFAGISVIALIVLIGLSFACFSQANKKVGSGMSVLENLTEISDAHSRMLFYLQESSKLSSQQAFYDLAEAAAIDASDQNQKCFTKPVNGENIIQFTDSCKPDTDASEKILMSEYGKSMENFIGNYTENISVEIESALDNNMISTSAKAEFYAVQKSSYAKYNMSCAFSEKIITSLSEEQIYPEDFSEMFLKGAGALNECRNAAEIKSCIEGKIAMDRWNVVATPEDGWVLFEFSTKKQFFFYEKGEKFGKITSKFGISL